MSQPLKEYRLRFEQVPAGEAAVDGESNGLQSKLGGHPNWIQEDETPECLACSQPIRFVGQLDSIEHDTPNNPHRIDCLSEVQEFVFGDVGLIYIFFCFDCCTTKSVFQCA